MIVDFDDFHEHNHKLELLRELKQINPEFKATLFAVPGLGSPKFWNQVPDWLELVPHGWVHPDSYECDRWSMTRLFDLVEDVQHLNRYITDRPGFVHGFKAPGWQISQSCFYALAVENWWVADQHYNDERRPIGLRCHLIEMPDSDSLTRVRETGHWHGHIQDVCGNGLSETFQDLRELVAAADHFQFVSEVVTPWS